MKKLVLTYGDLNGIGVEVLIKALNFLDLAVEDIVIAGSKKVFDFYEKNYGLKLNKNYEIAETELKEGAFSTGEENAVSGEHCFQCLKKACELVKSGAAKNIVTGTVSKHVLNMAGYNFSGQTEILEHFLAKNGEHSDMLFVAENFRILLATRHLSVKNISDAINEEMLCEKISRLKACLKDDFKISAPKIGVLALNPHAGENGILGNEEIDVIRPVVESFKDGTVFGPLVADAEFAKFGRTYFAGEKPYYDCYVAMYHDQGLIPMKLLAGDKAVNTTIGLCSIRTSPSHGTAFDIAGKGIARPDSMVAAIELAVELL